MTLRADHVAGSAFALAGALVIAFSGDLPTGTLSLPGAGMLPKLAAGLAILFGLMLVTRAGESRPLAEIAWTDLNHALLVVIPVCLAVAFYERIGFLVSMALMLFALTAGVERRRILPAALFSAGVPLVTYYAFTMLLRTPLPRGVLGF